MFQFTSVQTVSQSFKLTDLLKKVGADSEIKADAKCIKAISLEYVLNEKTIGMKPDTIKEIYFFIIETEGFQIPLEFITALDGIIRIQTVFILKSEQHILVMTNYKSKSKKNNKRKYMQTEWRSVTENIEFPRVDTLDQVYKFILGQINPYPPFVSETIDEYINRFNLLKKLDYQISKTTKAIEYEVQSKKRFEYNKNLKEYEKEHQQLTNERMHEYGKINDGIEEYLSRTYSED